MVDFLPNPKITRQVSHARRRPWPRPLTVRLRSRIRPVPAAALLSAGDLYAPSERLRHPGHPRRPGGRPGHGRGGGADLPDLDLQAGRRRRAARRVRVLAVRQPDPDRARGVLRGARGRRRAASRSRQRPRRPRTPSSAGPARPGDHVVVPNDAYGGTYRLLRPGRPGRAGSTTPSPRSDEVDDVRAAIRPGRHQAGLGRDADQPAARHRRHRRHRRGRARRRARCSSSTTPSRRSYLQSPIALGADVVVHSTTKYCGGHSDVVGGALVIAKELGADGFDGRLGADRFHQNAIGAVAGPFDSWLVLRGLKTLAVRMERHCDNAERVVEHLLDAPRGREGLLPRSRRTTLGTPSPPSRCAASAAWSP